MLTPKAVTATRLKFSGRDKPAAVFTIGHSTHPVGDFIRLLQENQIAVVADIRRFPQSRRNPQFGSSALKKNLSKAGIAYAHFPELGGMRSPQKNSPNAGWENASFRGYADHLRSEEFSEGLSRLLDLSEKSRIVLMCAEALPWRCHRKILADVLILRGIPAAHILSRGNTEPHELTAFAETQGRLPVYPKKNPAQAEFQFDAEESRS